MKWHRILLGVFGLGLTLRAQGPADLGPREKTEVFIQHLVKVSKLDPTLYRALVLEHEIGAAMADFAGEQDEAHAEKPGHDKDAECCAGTLGSIAVAQNFMQAALRELHPPYAQALKYFEEGRFTEAREIAKALSLKSDPYLAAHGSLLFAEAELALARAEKGAVLRDTGAFTSVLDTCERISRSDRLYLIEDHRACELIALCFEALGKTLQEATQYAILLTDYNDLPGELRDRARARLAALEEASGNPLGTVASWMNKVKKLLDEGQTAKDPTQLQEIDIVSALDKLIELQEARERKTCRGCGSRECRGGCKKGSSGGPRSQAPAQVSALSEGRGETNLHGVSRADRGTIWGELKEREGSRALQGFRGKLPERYERLLEQYYKNLSRGK